MRKKSLGLFLICVLLLVTMISCGNEDKLQENEEIVFSEPDNTVVENIQSMPEENFEADNVEAEESEIIEESVNNGGWSVTQKGSIVCNEISESLSFNNAIVYKSGDKKGLVDNNGNVRIEPEFDYLEAVSEDYCIGYNDYSKTTRSGALMTTDGEVILSFGEGCNVIYVENGYTLLNGNEVFSLEERKTIFTIDDIESNENSKVYNQLFVTDNCFYILSRLSLSVVDHYYTLRIFDKDGNLIHRADNITYINADDRDTIFWEIGENEYAEFDGTVYNSKDEKMKFTDFCFRFSYRLNKKHKLFVTRELGVGSGVKNFSGETIIPMENESCFILNNGFIIVDNGGEGLYNSNGTKLCDNIYDDFSINYYDGYIGVKMGDYWGIMDENGNEVYPTRLSKTLTNALKEPAYFINGVGVINFKTGEQRDYKALNYEDYPEGLFMFEKDNGSVGLSTYEKEFLEVEDAEIFCTADKKVAIVKQYNNYTFYELEKN